MIYLNPKACDGLYLTLFQRNSLSAYQEVDSGVADVLFKYFVEHGSQYLQKISAENVAFGLYSDSLLMSFDAKASMLDAVKTSTCLPASVNVFVQLRKGPARLKFLLTAQSKTAPCVLCANVPAAFWRASDHNNRCTKRLIGKLKNIIQNRLCDSHYKSFP